MKRRPSVALTPRCSAPWWAPSSATTSSPQPSASTASRRGRFRRPVPDGVVVDGSAPVIARPSSGSPTLCLDERGVKAGREGPERKPKSRQTGSLAGARTCPSPSPHEVFVSLRVQRRGVVPQVVLHERGDEVVAVVIPLMDAQRERLPRGVASLLQQLRLELLLEELVARALVHQQRGKPRLRGADELRGVVLAPRGSVLAQVALERLLSPGHAHGRDDGREGGHGAVALRIAQRAHQRAMASHGVPEDALTVLPGGEVLGDERGQLPGDVRAHAVARGPGRLGGVQVEARAHAEHFPAREDRQGIFGHSMGGHGALVCALRNPERYRSVSAFAPIVAPMRVPWGQKAFKGYLGEDTAAWREYDATELIRSAKTRLPPLLVDQGTGDKFLQEQLKPELLKEACDATGQPLTLRIHEGYDHGYYFISTFMEDHLRHHAAALNA